MAGITQQVPNYVMGMSQQPDELKAPGQLVDIKNAIPDVTRGLSKRPGGQLVSAITPNGGTLSWFHIYIDEDTQFIGNVNTSGVVQVWRTSDGASIPIGYDDVPGTNACTYLTGWTDSNDIQGLTLNEHTFLTNRTVTTAMKTGGSDKSPAALHEAIIELKTVSYGKQYAVDIFDPTSTATATTTRATAIALTGSPSGIETGSDDDGSCGHQAREILTKTGVSLGGGSRTGNNLRVELDVRCIPVVDPANVGTASSGAQYNNSYSPFVQLQFGGEGWQENDTTTLTMENGFSHDLKITKHASIVSRANIGAIRPAATSSSVDEAVTANGILGDLKAAIDASESARISGGGSDVITTSISGNSLHLSRASAFNITTPEPQLLSIVAGSAQTIGDLPMNARHGMIVKISNSGEDDDDYYLKFKADNQTAGSNETLASPRFGTGVWNECTGPDLPITFDNTTMPVKLVRGLPGTYNINGTGSQSYSNGIFKVQPIEWVDRLVGDESSNPSPSFLGEKINKLLLFRSRLVVLASDTVVCSRTNDEFNFWSKSAQSITNDDPIDISSSSTLPTVLYDATEVNSGLIVFSSNQQFMLTTDSDVFAANTAKLNYLSAYNFNHKTKPFSLGITSGFINSTGKNARFYEMAEVRREGEPTIIEQSKIISKKFPIDITLPTTSKENNIVLFGSVDKRDVWGYKYYNTGEKRVQSAWFRWELPANLVYHTIMDDVYYTIVKVGSDYNLEAYDVKTQDDTLTVGTSPDIYKVHLDCHKDITAAQLGYSETTKRTGVTKPAGFIHTDRQLAVYVNKNSSGGSADNLGRYALASIVGTNIEWDGDWTDGDVVIGYLFDWLVELPTIYPVQSVGEKTRSDTRASLIVHRLNFNFGSVGVINSTLKRKGKKDYTKTYESLEWDTYNSSTIPIADEYIHTIPAYERNTNLTVQLTSDHPTPATLHSMTWEGDYNNKFYSRA